MTATSIAWADLGLRFRGIGSAIAAVAILLLILWAVDRWLGSLELRRKARHNHPTHNHERNDK